MSIIALLFLPLAFSSLPVVLPFVSPSSQVGQVAGAGLGNVCELTGMQSDNGRMRNAVQIQPSMHY